MAAATEVVATTNVVPTLKLVATTEVLSPAVVAATYDQNIPTIFCLSTILIV